MAKVLFVNNRGGRSWTNLLRQAVLNLGGTLTLLDQQEVKDNACVGFDLIILDAGVVNDLALIIRTIRSSNPLARIVVVSPTPHWKQARETLLVGGSDYVRKADDEAALLGFLQDSLSKVPSA
jgi:DNA-binding NarL/FixJ family response regulator